MKEKIPQGYFADHEVKRDHDRKRQEESALRKKRDKELEKNHRLKRNERDELICMRCDEPVLPTEGSMRSVKCKTCERIWFEENN